MRRGADRLAAAPLDLSAPPLTAIAAGGLGDWFVAGLTEDGEAWWTARNEEPIELPAGPLHNLVATRWEACALDAEDIICCWGGLGPDTYAGKYRQISGAHRLCALDYEGEITCF